MTVTQGFGRGSGPWRSHCQAQRPPGRPSMRRLAERPANLLFFGRSILTKG